MKKMMLAALAATGAMALAVPALADGTAPPADAPFLTRHAEALAGAIGHPTRAEDRARDQFRHPAETLAFFQVAPDMKVGEYAPGGGWYSRLLGHYLGGEGKLVGLYPNPVTASPTDAARQQRVRDSAAGFPAEVAGYTGLPAERFAGMTLENIPAEQKGTFDRILVMRMLHNMLRSGTAISEIRAMRELLKDDGMIGIEQHRAKADAPWSYANGTKGYLREDDIIDFMRINGFELVGKSEVNANPRDPANHAEGVWEMPPILATKRGDLKGLGESDRMTLLFRKAN